MANTISPNMSLIIPGVGTEAGPTYAFDVNASLTLIDAHDHSPGSGVQITPAGININASLDFKAHNAINLNTVAFNAQSVPSAVIQSLSVGPGGEGTVRQDLFYTDDSGTAIQITKGGIVNATATSIPGESYAGGTFIWTQTQSSLPTTPANFDIGSITLRPNIAATSYGVTLSPPAAIGSAYTLLLPNNPSTNTVITGNAGAPAFVTIASTGQIEGTISTSGGISTSNIANLAITTAKIADGAVTAAKLAAGALQPNTQLFTANGNFTVPTGVTTLFVELVGGGGGGGGGSAGPGAGGGGGGGGNPLFTTIQCTPAEVLLVSVGAGGGGGAGGIAGSAGSDSSISRSGGAVLVVRSTGALGGSGAASITLGGNGGDLAFTASRSRVPGGGGGDSSVSGNAGFGSSYANGGAGGANSGTAGGGGGGGAGVAPAIGGSADGGVGGAGASVNGFNGLNGPANSGAGGGGGGGGGSNAGNGGSGGSGFVRILWMT